MQLRKLGLDRGVEAVPLQAGKDVNEIDIDHCPDPRLGVGLYAGLDDPACVYEGIRPPWDGNPELVRGEHQFTNLGFVGGEGVLGSDASEQFAYADGTWSRAMWAVGGAGLLLLFDENEPGSQNPPPALGQQTCVSEVLELAQGLQEPGD